MKDITDLSLLELGDFIEEMIVYYKAIKEDKPKKKEVRQEINAAITKINGMANREYFKLLK